MSYDALEKKIRQIPERYLDEVSCFVDYIIYKSNTKKDNQKESDLSKYFGSVKFDLDGLEIQKGMRE